MDEVKQAVGVVEQRMGKKFGAVDNPLLVSVRSGAGEGLLPAACPSSLPSPPLTSLKGAAAHRTYTHTRAHTHTRTHARTHTHTHTHTFLLQPSACLG